MSGILQSGYSLGCLLAAVLTRGLVDTTKYGWRPLFWFGACPPILVILFRLCLGETEAYEETATLRNESTNIKSFVAEAEEVLKSHWARLLYLILFMTAFSTLVCLFAPSRLLYMSNDLLVPRKPRHLSQDAIRQI